MAVAAAPLVGRRAAASAKVHARLQLQQQPHRGEHAHLRTDGSAAAARRGGRFGQDEGLGRDEGAQRMPEDDGDGGVERPSLDGELHTEHATHDAAGGL
ncbi:hypothetical protein HMPREF9148_02057 [Prevotella sp. F0091]|nr:hypothetical protein HMPREF9148_02057 [Prevotella sp. F0091]